MASPFPGMDPYLEKPILWEDVQVTLMGAIRAQLTHLLPPGFRARIEKHLRIEETPQRIRPDVTISTARRPPATTGGILLLERPATEEKNPPLLLRHLREESPQRYIEIVAMGQSDRIVTTIELLSPANKMSGRGREEYVTKQTLLLASSSHLLEIDLLRAGEYTVAAPRDEALVNSPYRVSLHRAGSEIYEAWPIALQESLPSVRIPLTEGHPDLYLDLQVALNRTLDDAGYENELDYTADPLPPLAPQDLTYIDDA